MKDTEEKLTPKQDKIRVELMHACEEWTRALIRLDNAKDLDLVLFTMTVAREEYTSAILAEARSLVERKPRG